MNHGVDHNVTSSFIKGIIDGILKVGTPKRDEQDHELRVFACYALHLR